VRIDDAVLQSLQRLFDENDEFVLHGHENDGQDDGLRRYDDLHVSPKRQQKIIIVNWAFPIG